MADNVSLPSDEAILPSDMEQAALPSETAGPSASLRQRAFREQIRMGEPEQAAQVSFGGEKPAVAPIAEPPQPKSGMFLDRDERGNLVAREMPVTGGAKPEGVLERMSKAAKAGLGEEPFGISPETREKYPWANTLQLAAYPADVVLRGLNAFMTGGAGAVAGVAEQLGMSPADANRLQRDIYQAAQVAAVEAPKPTPGMMTKPIVRAAETTAPTVETIDFMTGKPIPKPIETVAEKLPEITTPEGAKARLEQLAGIAEAEPRAVPRPESGARLIPATTPYEMRSPRASVGAAANPEAGPLANILPETKEQLIRIFEPELQNEYMLEQKLGEMSSHHMLGEFSPSTLNELNTLNSLGGQARNEVINSVTHRSTEFGNRARALLDREMGAAEDIRSLNKAEAEARDLASTPLFEQFRSTIIPLDEEGKIQKLLPRLKEAGAIQKANRKMGISGEAAEQRFGDTAVPTAQAFQYAKEALDDLIGKSIREGERGDSRLYTKLKKDLLDAIDNHPDPNVRGVWEKARKAFSIPSEIIEARMAGENALSSKLHWSELKEIYDSYSPEAQAAYRQGLRASLEDILEGKGSQTRINTNLRNTLLAPANLRKINSVYGNEVAENIANGFRHEESMASNARSIMQRSPTADLKAAQKNWLPSETMPEKAEKLSEFAHAPVKSAVKHGFEKIKSSAIEAEAAKANRVREEAARILTLQGAEKEEALAQIYRMILERKQPSGAGTPEIGIPGINRATGGSVFDKMHEVRRRQEGGEIPFADEPGWEALPKSPEGRPRLTITPPVEQVEPVNEAAEAQAAREAAAQQIAGGLRGRQYEPMPPSTEGKTWMMEPGKEEVQSGTVNLPQGVALNDAGVPFNLETGEELSVVRRPNVIPLIKTPEGEMQWAMPKVAELAGDIVNPLAVTRGVPVKAGEFVLGAGPVKTPPEGGVLGAMQAAKAERELSPLGFYSHGAETAAQLPQAKGTPEQIAAMLQKQGVKPAELEGFNEAFAGRPSVTREEAAQFFRDRMPQVEETVLGEWGKPPIPESRYRELAKEWETRQLTPEEMREFNSYERYVNGERPDGSQPYVPTKYHNYTLPGGENYREVLLKLPEKKRGTDAELSKLALEHYGKDIEQLSFSQLNDLVDGKLTNFKSSHWDDPNVLVHIRMSDRTGPNGEKILHVEEMQSDWGQKGRKEGFKGGNPLTENEKTEFQRLNTMPDAVRTSQEKETLEKLYARLRAERSGAPSAPYVTSTQGWTDLALKRVLKEAAEGGYDRVVFTPGAEQAARYDLSKHVDSLLYKKNPDGTYQVSAQVQGQGQILGNGKLTKEELSNYVGKEVAERIVKEEGKRTEVAGKYDPVSMTSSKDYMNELSGEGLKVGGEGMKGYYDKIMPTQLNKLASKYDKQAKVQLGGYELPTKEGGTTQGHFIDITPKMREAILGGQTAFKRGGSVLDKMREAARG